MATDPSIETSSKPKARLKVKSLMLMVGLAALFFGMLAQTGRTLQSQRADKLRFDSWIAEFEKAHPSLKLIGSSERSDSSLFELTRTCTANFQTPTGKYLTVQAKFRSGPFSTVRNLTFDGPGRSVTWPFEDVSTGRTIDLKAEFPDTFP